MIYYEKTIHSNTPAPTFSCLISQGWPFSTFNCFFAIYSHLSIYQAYNDITWFLNFSIICWVPIVGGKVLMIEGKNLILLPQINKCNCHPLSPHVLNMIIPWFFYIIFLYKCYSKQMCNILVTFAFLYNFLLFLKVNNYPVY